MLVPNQGQGAHDTAKVELAVSGTSDAILIPRGVKSVTYALEPDGTARAEFYVGDISDFNSGIWIPQEDKTSMYSASSEGPINAIRLVGTGKLVVTVA